MLIHIGAAKAAFADLPLAPASRIPSPFLVLAPHPDDESLGCGGAIALACAAGAPPLVAILTDGAMSHPKSCAYPAAARRALREAETGDAADALGLTRERLVFLGLPDAGAPVAGDAFEATAVALVALARAEKCRAMLAPWRHDPHCDHEAAALLADRVAAEAGLELLSYPVWGWALPDEASRDVAPIAGFRLAIDAVLARKRAAIAAHRSQHGQVILDDPDGFVLPPALLARFASPVETYLERA